MRAARLAWSSAAAILLMAGPVAAQQSSVQISSETQFVAADQSRRTGERDVQPDVGIMWLRPTVGLGEFQMEARATRRGDHLHLGRTWLALRDAKTGRFSWTLEAGDIYTLPTTDYQFSNLAAPSFTFTGASAAAKTSHLTLQVVGGQSTALRNIFGSDPDRLGQTVGLARATYQPDGRVQITGRAARVRTSDLDEFTPTIDASDLAGGGARVTVRPSIQLVADGNYVRYRATGASASTGDYSYVAGTHLLLSRGWAQVNAVRFSPGEMPLLNAALQDRSGIFAAAEYDLFSSLRAFGGWETIDTNINPRGTSILRPQGTAKRGFGGFRAKVGGRSTVSLRIEDGGRVSTPLVPQPGVPVSSLPTTSDTGVISADWQSNLGKVTAFARYSRRENVDVSTASSSFTQHDSSAQLFVNVSRGTQLFGVATITHQVPLSGGGNTFLQITSGAQQRVFNPGLWLRVEGTTARNYDLLTGVLAPRNALSLGLNGQLTRQTTIGLNVYMDRAPSGLLPGENGWFTRSMLRVVHTIPSGSAVRVSGALATSVERQNRATGLLSGTVFADWNGNGVPDPGEEQLAGIPLRLGTSHITTGRDGQFTFLNVPVGSQLVGLDVGALPIDFDPPAAPDVTVEVARGATRRVAFGLLPLGNIRGTIVEDANRNGQIDVGEPTIDGVVMLDGGQRSEIAQKGSFRFDAVRSGDHRVELMKESLPEGAVITGDAERAVAITRDHLEADVSYLVVIEKRPEVRKVFPPRFGARTTGPRTPPSAAPSKTAVTAAKTAPAPPSADAPRTAESFTVQIAALRDAPRARALAERLKQSGYAAYVVEPGDATHDGLFRVRVGRFSSRGAAQDTMVRLQRQLGERPWIARE